MADVIGNEPAYYKTHDDEAVWIDYSVLSVGVMTLGLILMVEVARHKLDHQVEHSVFYKAVLKGVYSELATLGIVEFLLHVMAEYHENYDAPKKHVFADVHFLLFYTAILNALQSALLYNVVQRISKKLWIDTEKLDVGHYLELREEFDSVRTELDNLRHRQHVQKNVRPDDTENPTNFVTADECSDDSFALTAAGVVVAIQNVMDRIRYPALKAKHNELLVQVRFHELRVHILQAYDLPVKFRVSDYLMRSELHVLVQLINVSPIAWLLLTGLVNLLYYLLGIVSIKMRSAKIVGVVMIYLFFGAIFLFLVLSWIVHNKMKNIYKQIMNSDRLWNVGDGSSERTHLAVEQKSLFWAGDPTLVIAAIQFMQFGYAVAVSTVTIFWEELNDGPTPMAIYVLVVCSCYSVFIGVTAHIIPRYTLCTNLAQLVDAQRLHEAVASFRLREAQHREKEKAEVQYHNVVGFDSMVSSVPWINPATKLGSSVGGGSSVSNQSSAVLRRPTVKPDTRGLRVILRDSVQQSRGSKQRAEDRAKQSSDGVSSMTRNKLLSATPSHSCTDHSVSTSCPTVNHDVAAQLVAPRRKARSEGVLFMANGNFALRNELPKTHGFNDDDLSIDSSSSGHSDINDIPIATPVGKNGSASDEKTRVSLKTKLYAYFMSRRFIVISNVFGTMVVFFFIGQRVESFYLSEGIGSQRFVHFDFAHDFVFWFLFTWLAFFIIQTILVFYSIGCRPHVSRNERVIVVAAVLDCVLTGGCMLLFLYAEYERCCIPGETVEMVVDDNQKSVPCSCAVFGSRQYGGLGIIEPWISLIVIRIFRHWFAKCIVLMTDQDKPYTLKGVFLKQPSQRFNPFDVFTESDQAQKPDPQCSEVADRDDHGAADLKGTAAELWETAVGRHPNLVAKHGEFSAEILRVMLGFVPTDKAEEYDRGYQDLSTERTFTVQKSLAHLSKDAQRLIASGVLGGDVKEVATRTSDKQPQFQLCRWARQSSELSIFIAPDATLLRSMRRCDKKFLPLLGKWTVVDIVLTRFEIVYFAADNSDNCALDASSDAAHEALTATKGGKGCLRLCDVARGRRVVGCLDLGDLLAVHVDRISGADAYPEEKSNVEVENTEFWKQSHVLSKGEHDSKPRGERWASVQQDQLRLVTGQGETVYLRFYSDLEDATNNPGMYASDDYEIGKVAKNNALHWAQTIGRICGKSQLNQTLDHFGQGDSREVFDYLVVGPHNKKSSSLFSSLRDLGVKVEM